MSNRLPPAWAKHLKTQPAPKGAPPKVGQPKLQPAMAAPSRAQANDMMLRQALEFQQQNRLPEAEELCHRVLARTPEHPLALYVLGTLGIGYDDEKVLRYFGRAIAQEPLNPYYHLSLGQAYLRLSEFTPAIKHIQHALALKPDLVEALCALGDAYNSFDKGEMALPLYEKALRVDRDHPAARLGLPRALASLGRMDEAATHLKEAIERRIAIPAAYNALVRTRKFAEEPPELEAILTELQDPNHGSEGAPALHHAAGKLLNDLRRYKEAMDHFKKGNQAGGQRFDLQSYRRWVDALIETFTPELVASRSARGNTSEVPVFVVGMPRSGTTLTEQICASHPAVHGAGELTKLRRISNGIDLGYGSDVNPREALALMTPELSTMLAAEHVAYLRERAPDALRIVDKMPHNFELVGLIGILFPNARVIHCRRDAIDNCISCFVLQFSTAHSYSADLETLGLYYREYDRLMRHWDKIFPGRIFENRYETLIENQEKQSRRLIDYLGLPWHDACLRFFDRGGSVNTYSDWQVRQPIYTSSVKRWKNYESEIQPLIEALGDLADI
ncbi:MULTISPECIES: tetratricopeptide repeat-containing sulfotransferase family protein [unclassified Mesorhizobium]|uniref:tetratricopeptide repeat-containing sulfotransferase family protein n=1 Tax=unclassified Mesorhizobium TaxID=325217 RepID=UPI0003CF9A36|nr:MULTISPECIES: tetratricopeptide repeat-containing sulfotransferase family protein [unclassified Mesorhizobium]ESX17700.1 sulfotransferase [Mesorhizobium sp. LSJC255A00]ESX27064.1 sulfotransferase [Mesorhizobium sp. LSHC440B00]ESX36251.1 sulfotransferase [Mesorhizobium sp. LSHC432A00]ESX40210.1 sulfotransferase [Mesorhizobium sp. LSHC440A00]ESX74387.1 sulfotransferase [Mesorhizobium sp. LSHC414A00]